MSVLRKALLVLLPTLCTVTAVLLWESQAPSSEQLPGDVVQPVASSEDASAEDAVQVIDPADVKARLTAAVEAGGAAGGVAEFKRIVEEDPFSVSICHGMYEHIGREATRLLGRLPEYTTPECQFGFLHGALYALVGKFDTAQALVDAVDPYCQQFEEDKDAVLDPKGSCYHGLGHLAAAMYPSDPLLAIDACGLVAPLDRHTCVDGALMEYGEDELVRSGWMEAGAHDNNDVDTEVGVEKVESLCAEVPQYALVKCYARLWMFLGPVNMPSPEKGEVVCNTAPTEEAYDRCHEGFGEFVVLVDMHYSEFPWPPATKEEALEVAQRMVRRCERHQEEGLCLTGGIVSTIAHLFALEPDEEVVPNPCEFVSSPAVASHCEQSMELAKALNWDLENPEQS